MLTHTVPAETDILCEHCGHDLSGLPSTATCPECGHPIADSTTNDRRDLPLWESVNEPGWGAFLATTLQIIFTPKRFFRHLRTRPGAAAYDSEFAKRHRIIAAFLFGGALLVHADWTLRGRIFNQPWLYLAIYGLSAVAATGIFLALVTWAAASLTKIEGTYRGYRVPLDVVRRAMNYHAAQLLPVALITFLTVLGFRLAVQYGYIPYWYALYYLYVLCAEVVLFAFHLFRTYWIAMRNIMYANR
jgi:uncharacterized membrane protein